METWKELLKKRIKVIYDDCGQYPSKKEGILEGYTDTHLFLKINEQSQILLLSKILRVEVIK